MESILDLSLDDFNQSVKNNATPSMYQHNDEEYYNDDPDDGVEILQKEIRQYEDKDGRNQQPAKQRLTKQSSEEPSEQPREEPSNKEAKQQQTKQQHNNDDNGANNQHKRNKLMRPYGAKTINQEWQKNKHNGNKNLFGDCPT